MAVIYTMAHNGPLQRGELVQRPNRFVVIARIQGCLARCYLPNPGRLWELLSPGAELLLDPTKGGATEYTVLGVLRGDTLTPLHTHRANDLAAELIRQDLVPGLEGARVARREVTAGDSRYDLLLRQGSQEIYGEVKCCTLFAGGGGYFPDAPSQRACRHLRGLEALSLQGHRAVVMVIVNSAEARWFLPDWHTDPDFAETLLTVRHHLDIVALALGWNREAQALGPVRRLPIPWKTLERENVDAGVMLVLVEAEGVVWALVESCPHGLSRAMAGWTRPKKRPQGAAEKLRSQGRLVALVPFRSPQDFLPELAQDLNGLLQRPLEPDGQRWIGAFAQDPRRWPPFVDWLLRYRFTRLDRRIEAELVEP